MNFLTFLKLIFFPLSFAQVHVAFFEQYNPQKQLIRLEPNGRFFHIAISYEGGWLHAHPFHGVVAVSDVKQIGRPAVVLSNAWMPALTIEQIRPFVGLSYDPRFRWEDQKSSYCSKLVGQLLGLKPRPMHFEAIHWARLFKTQGELGLSPDDVYEELLTEQKFEAAVAPLDCKRLLF